MSMQSRGGGRGGEEEGEERMREGVPNNAHCSIIRMMCEERKGVME